MNLPKDIYVYIGLKLDIQDISRFSRTCKKIQNKIWKNKEFWMNKYIHDYGNFWTFEEMYKEMLDNKLDWMNYYCGIWLTYNDNDTMFQLDAAASLDDINLVKLLLTKNDIIDDYTPGFNFDSYKRYSYPFNTACETGHTEIVKLLLDDKRFRPDIPLSGKSSLMVACEKGFYDIVKILIDSDRLYVWANDSFGYTAQDYAIQNKHYKIAQLFKDHIIKILD